MYEYKCLLNRLYSYVQEEIHIYPIELKHSSKKTYWVNTMNWFTHHNIQWEQCDNILLLLFLHLNVKCGLTNDNIVVFNGIVSRTKLFDILNYINKQMNNIST